MRTLVFRALAGVCLLTGLLQAAPTGGAARPYERLICIVPMIGSGTLDDPKRPMFAPVAGANAELSAEPSAKKTKGFLEAPVILSYHSVPTDDGLFAIVEFVAKDRAAFQSIKGNTLGLTVIDPQKISLDALLQQLRSVKKDFDLTSFLGGAL